MKIIFNSITSIFALGLSLTALAKNNASMPSSSHSDPQVVQTVDYKKYEGLWYEIAHSKNFFQFFCHRSTAQYTLLSDTSVRVENTCYRNEKVLTSIEGTAKVINPEEVAKLKVDFGFGRKGDYWIVRLDPHYQWAVVSGPNKKSLFILARSAPMDPKLLDDILLDLRSDGFRTDHLVYDQYPAGTKAE